jgi:hypothetical protein
VWSGQLRNVRVWDARAVIHAAPQHHSSRTSTGESHSRKTGFLEVVSDLPVQLDR